MDGWDLHCWEIERSRWCKKYSKQEWDRAGASSFQALLFMICCGWIKDRYSYRRLKNVDAGPGLILEAFSHFFARHKHPDNGKKGFRSCFVRGNEQREMCGPLPAVSALVIRMNRVQWRYDDINEKRACLHAKIKIATAPRGGNRKSADRTWERRQSRSSAAVIALESISIPTATCHCQCAKTRWEQRRPATIT